MTGRRPPARTYTQAEVDAIEARAKAAGKDHGVTGVQQVQTNAQMMADQIVAKMPKQSLADVPVWLKITGSLAALTVASLVILGIVWNMAIAPINQRLAMLETGRTEAISLLTAMANRSQATETKLAQFETSFSTATRLRDQQQQGTNDRMRALELSDQTGAERLGQLAQTIASILPRLEEILRRQERLENRLSSGPRPQNEDAPATFFPPLPPHI